MRCTAVSRRCSSDESFSRAVCTAVFILKNKLNLSSISVDIISKQTYSIVFNCLFLFLECLFCLLCSLYTKWSRNICLIKAVCIRHIFCVYYLCRGGCFSFSVMHIGRQIVHFLNNCFRNMYYIISDFDLDYLE